ncbi:MAG: hypothetical protein FJ267_12630, partial [Planctomycetes bacterium]|nr:hypothetical protein [Planctomycetota bacterium]
MVATVTVATADSSNRSKGRADYLCDGIDDQVQINAAINSLPAAGGLVHLYEGTYDIRKSSTIAGISIRRSNITLVGMGASTRLYLAANQVVNVIRIEGNGTENVAVKSMYINGNRSNGNRTTNSGNFDVCGVRALTTGTTVCKNIVVEDCRIEECNRLNIMLSGEGVYARNCHIGNADSDSVELLGGPGEITGCYLDVAGYTGFGLGSDAASTIRISNNTVRVRNGGFVEQAIFRTWGGQYRNILDGNQVWVENGGVVNRVFETNGYLNVISNNGIHGQAP